MVSGTSVALKRGNAQMPLTTTNQAKGVLIMAEATIAQFGLIFKQFFQGPQGRIHAKALTLF